MAGLIGLGSLMRKLAALGGDLPAAMVRGVSQTTIKAEADARNNAPAGGGSQADSNGTGSIKGSIKHEIKPGPDQVEGRVFTNASHGSFVEHGTGPVGAANHGGISPHVSPSYTSRESWVYPTVIDGEETFRTTSGQPARPYMYPAAVQNKDSFESITRGELEASISRVVG